MEVGQHRPDMQSKAWLLLWFPNESHATSMHA